MGKKIDYNDEQLVNLGQVVPFDELYENYKDLQLEYCRAVVEGLEERYEIAEELANLEDMIFFILNGNSQPVAN